MTRGSSPFTAAVGSTTPPTVTWPRGRRRAPSVCSRSSRRGARGTTVPPTRSPSRRRGRVTNPRWEKLERPRSQLTRRPGPRRTRWLARSLGRVVTRPRRRTWPITSSAPRTTRSEPYASRRRPPRPTPRARASAAPNVTCSPSRFARSSFRIRCSVAPSSNRHSRSEGARWPTSTPRPSPGDLSGTLRACARSPSQRGWDVVRS